ncbi:MAG: hypothetical protein NTW14_12670 [bacterium]|nr:hypothetical protein [bacterium]
MELDYRTLGLMTLTPPQSKQLIAEAVAIHPAVRRALAEGTIIIGHGTTNARIAARLTGKPVDEIRFSAGIIRGGDLDVTPKEERLPAVILRRGKLVDGDPFNFLTDFGRDDVLIKGANAIDPDGMVGVLMCSREGGTIGRSLGIVTARGATLIIPIGLEKLIPSVPEAARNMGQDRINVSTGEKAGLMPVVGAEVITELQALRLLTGVKATMVASGGWGDSQGAVTLSVSGQPPQVEAAIQWAQYVKGRSSDHPM